MNSKGIGGLFSNIKNDLPASIVVFLVAVPLCLGIALLCGVPIFSGIIAGIVGGLVVSLISGSSIGVSGPAAGLIAIVIGAIDSLGAFEIFLLAVVLAGVIQILLGIVRAGVIGYYFPNSVIKGMLAGIGVIIILKNIPHAVGYDASPEGNFGFFQVDGQNTFSELINMLNFVNPGAVFIAVVSLLILFLWEQPFMKKFSIFKVIQGPLIAVVAGILINLGFQGTGFSLSEQQMVNIPIASSFSGFMSQFTLPDFSQILNYKVWMFAGIIALVASLETLLCVEATDKLDPKKRVTPTNRELVAQGVGNMASGLVGGLPVTQVIVRSSANVQSGGRTKVSAFFHGILLFGCVLLIPNVLNMVPYASLAAILFVVGFKLAKPALFVSMYRLGWSQFIPYLITIVGIVFTDLLVGIGMGMAVAVIQILWINYRRPYHFDAKKYKEGEPITIDLAEEVSFLNKAAILNTLKTLPQGVAITVDGTKTNYIHPDVVEIIEDFQENAASRGVEVTFIRPKCLGFKVNPRGEFNKTVGNGDQKSRKWKLDPSS